MVTKGKPYILDGQPTSPFGSPILYISAEEDETLHTGETIVVDGKTYALGDVYFFVVDEDDPKFHVFEEGILK